MAGINLCKWLHNYSVKPRIKMFFFLDLRIILPSRDLPLPELRHAHGTAARQNAAGPSIAAGTVRRSIFYTGGIQ